MEKNLWLGGSGRSSTCNRTVGGGKIERIKRSCPAQGKVGACSTAGGGGPEISRPPAGRKRRRKGILQAQKLTAYGEPGG